MQAQGNPFAEGYADYFHRRDVTFGKALDLAALPDKGVSIPTHGVDIEGGSIFPADFCDTEPDYHDDFFDVAVLSIFARDVMAGKVIGLWMHDYENPIGYVLTAKVEPTATGHKLTGLIWINDAMKLPKQPEVSISGEVAKGRIKCLSVGFSGHLRRMTEGPEGSRQLWQWYVPTDQPDRTALREISVVPKGAQPVAMFKSHGPEQKDKSKIVNMTASKSIHVGGKEFDITAKQDGDSIKIDATAVNEAVKALEAAKADVDAKLKTATDEIAALKAANDKIREPFETDVLNAQKDLGKAALTIEQIKALPFDQLQALAEKASEQFGSANGRTTKTEKQSDNFKNTLL